MTVDDTIPMRLRRAYLTMHRVAQAHFAEFGITVDQYVLMSVLAEAEGIIQTQLSERMSSDANTVGAMLKLLEQKNVIRRQPSDRDRRAQRVYLTASGKRLHKKLVRHSSQIHQTLEAALTPRKRQTLLNGLDEITRALQ
ncbi:MarR family transcriptional regulator [Gimesia sp.]|uniref:MarR family winged helix-turn-helix transcriptional regulator n=1 Tax=Gimesia sp. TaxID=2024833 RepID=UPI000C4CC7AD|nr:MarR family transcriptional regulator [Gimesia sp.]MAX40007.1 MarR family transcriptional regulator [Gimesia sp.]HAH46435.1 MarR family transcriptional regulator [Planctomycetaceae bacterium]HBL43191.1 MarR family transcriptional regulator [Planctomycetaceae bacterium]|tara:strand:- start:22 stop:441 length:420 start_codon:yes stop_codon:yes gene_type:complete